MWLSAAIYLTFVELINKALGSFPLAAEFINLGIILSYLIFYFKLFVWSPNRISCHETLSPSSNPFLISLNIKLIVPPSCLALLLIPHYVQTIIQLFELDLQEPLQSGSKRLFQSHLLLAFPSPTSCTSSFSDIGALIGIRQALSQLSFTRRFLFMPALRQHGRCAAEQRTRGRHPVSLRTSESSSQSHP